MTADLPAQNTTPIFTIGELAEELGISTRTIRYYEERGLINPERTAGGQRVYTRRQRGRLKLILRGKTAGFDLGQIKEVIELYDVLPSDQVKKAQATHVAGMINGRLQDLDERILELEAMRRYLVEQRDLWIKKIEQ